MSCTIITLFRRALPSNKKVIKFYYCALFGAVIKFYYFFITRGNDTRNKHEWCLLHHKCLFQVTLPEELHKKQAQVVRQPNAR